MNSPAYSKFQGALTFKKRMQKVFKELLNCEQRISFRDSFHVDTKYGIFDYEKGKGSKRRKAQRKFFSWQEMTDSSHGPSDLLKMVP